VSLGQLTWASWQSERNAPINFLSCSSMLAMVF
jgi:hypothetical protein